MVDPDGSALFEPVHTASDRATDSSLYLVSVLAQAHDWSVTVETDETGTRFVFEGVRLQS